MNRTPVNSSPESRRRTVLIIWGAILMAVVMFFALTRFLGNEPRPSEDYNPNLLVGLAAAALTTFALSFALKAKLFSQAAAQRRPSLVASAYIIAFALCEAAALFGLLAFVVMRAPESVYFFILAAFGLALHFPRRQHFEDPTPGGMTFTGAA